MGWSTLNVRSRYSFLGIALFKASAYKHRLVCQFACLSVSAIAFFCCFFRIKLAYNKPRKVTMPNFWEKIFLWKNSRFWDFRLFFCGNEAISRQKIKKSKIWRIELWRSIFCIGFSQILALEIDLELSFWNFEPFLKNNNLDFCFFFQYKLAKMRA